MNVTFINRGISGNQVKDLQARWQEDALDLNPDVLSILIGINDTWRRFDANDPTSTQAYEDSYRDILADAGAQKKSGFKADFNGPIHAVRSHRRSEGVARGPKSAYRGCRTARKGI